MGVVLLLFNLSRPRRLIELSNVTQTASRTLAENSLCIKYLDFSMTVLKEDDMKYYIRAL
jgi:hypothetical protein